MIVVFRNIGKTATDPDHALLASDHHLLLFSTDQVTVILCQLDNRHEGSQQLAETLEVECSEDFQKFGRGIAILLLLELTVDDNLSMLDFLPKFGNKDATVAITLLTLLHLLNLVICVPVKTLNDLVSIEILVKVFIFWVINLDEIDTTHILDVFICLAARWRATRHKLVWLIYFLAYKHSIHIHISRY